MTAFADQPNPPPLPRDFNTRKTVDSTNVWLTPPKLIRALGEFDMDPCSPVNRPWDTAKVHYTEHDDGLAQQWAGRVWLNPPYGAETFKWVARLAEHGSGVALIFARTETKGFQEQVLAKAHGIFFIKGRIKFHREDGSCPVNGPAAPSCLISYSSDDTAAITSSGLPGVLVRPLGGQQP